MPPPPPLCDAKLQKQNPTPRPPPCQTSTEIAIKTQQPKAPKAYCSPAPKRPESTAIGSYQSRTKAEAQNRQLTFTTHMKQCSKFMLLSNELFMLYLKT